MWMRAMAPADKSRWRGTMDLQSTRRASKFRYCGKKEMMRARAVQSVLFLLLAGLAVQAQIPTAAPEPSRSETPSPALTVTQTPNLDNFNGSGAVDPLVPGVVP